MRRVCILGSTGSIGTQALDVLSHLQDEFTVIALAAGNNDDLLLQQVKAFNPKYVHLGNIEKAKEFASKLPSGVEFVGGQDALCTLSTLSDVDDVLVSVVGSMGLSAVLAAASCGKRILLANKEALVCGGQLVLDAVRLGGGELLPIDSEHSAIFQSLQGQPKPKKLILTASGGPFRTWPIEKMQKATLSDCLKHPTWDMGWKITLDSATLMNKGLEIIEAKWLFDVDEKDISVVVHPQSILHSAVEFADGSIIGQMGWPNMRMPIQYALTYPRRLHSPEKPFDFTAVASMTFEAPDEKRFPCLSLARATLRQGGHMPCIYNAAGEIAGRRFKDGHIGFMDIPRIVEDTLSKAPKFEMNRQGVMQADEWARQMAVSWTDKSIGG